MEKKRFGAFLKHFSLAQNTLKSNHKWPKSRFNLQGTVTILTKFDEDQTKIVDFLLALFFWSSIILF